MFFMYCIYVLLAAFYQIVHMPNTWCLLYALDCLGYYTLGPKWTQQNIDNTLLCMAKQRLFE